MATKTPASPAGRQNKKSQDKKLHVELVKQMVTLATSGFGLIAALAWNNVIREFVDVYIKKWLPQGSGLLSLLIYAVFITTIAVFVTFQLSKLLENFESKK